MGLNRGTTVSEGGIRWCWLKSKVIPPQMEEYMREHMTLKVSMTDPVIQEFIGVFHEVSLRYEWHVLP